MRRWRALSLCVLLIGCGESLDVGSESHPLIANPMSHDFGDILVFNTSPTFTGTILNDFSTDATVTDIKLVGADCGDYSLGGVANLPWSLASNESRNYGVEFTPTQLGQRLCRVQIDHDQPNSPILVDLAGNGVAPDIKLITSDPVDFGPVNLGDTSAPETLTLQNIGNADLTINALTVVGPQASDFTIVSGTVPVTIPPAANSSWTLTCSPSAPGARSAVLNVSSDDPDENPLTISLACDGVQSDLQVTPSPVSFPETRVCETSPDVTVTLANQGSAPVDITGTSIIGSEFAITSAPPVTTLAPTQTTAMKLSFSPLSMGTVNGTLVVTSTDPSSPLTVTLTGTGRLAAASVNPTTVAFGDVQTDQPPQQTTITVSNTGDADWQLTGVSLDDSVNFGIAPGTIPRTVGAASSTNVTVSAQPQSAGAHNATITLTTDIPGSPPCGNVPITIPVSVNGVEPDSDAGPGTPDAGPGTPDAGPGTPDAGPGTPDAGGGAGINDNTYYACSTGAGAGWAWMLIGLAILLATGFARRRTS